MRDPVRSYRPCLGLMVSPFFQDLLLTLHDFNFVIWKTDLETPIFKSANCPDQSQHIQCGCWSSTRPGVIFIGKTSGNIDVWDFLDQSHKPSMEFNLFANSITALSFQNFPNLDKKQYLVGYYFVIVDLVDIYFLLFKGMLITYVYREQRINSEHLQYTKFLQI